MDNEEFLEDLKVELDNLKRLGNEMHELLGKIDSVSKIVYQILSKF